MPEITLDCKGLACPEPVLLCKDCIDNQAPERFSVVVDNDASKENVTRFVNVKGYEVHAEKKNGFWTLSCSSSGPAKAPESREDPAPLAGWDLQEQEEKVTVFIGSSYIGTGDDELGAKLMLSFIGTLPELGDQLWRVILVNSGVKLAIEGSPALEKLQALAESGVTILVCGTCLDHFGLLEKKAVGHTTNMLDVVTSLQLAGKVITV
ncbi:MAG: sulfurtransferase-like selenium metabolism protein YedF [Thermodesulfobacteriota bacterium]|nr:sulfurtransferase-like selenium metabolism protein YedF [Thermodesulfobacteriota bacterium]